MTASAQAAEVKATYDEIVAAAKEESPVQWCTGMEQAEAQPIVDAFAAAYPDVPKPEITECFGQDATQRVIAEWTAGAPQIDLLAVDNEIMETLEKDNLTYVQDWTVFNGSPVEVDPRYFGYNGRVWTLGTALRVIWYNPTLIKLEDAPKSFEECADPKYKGMIAADVRPTFFEMMEEVGGPWSDEELKQWAIGVKANEPLWTRGVAQAYQVLSAGERAFICGNQLHGLFRSGATDPSSPDAPVKFIIPKDVIARDYGTTAMAPEPLAPNGSVLFAAFMASEGQKVIGEINPGYSSPHIEGSFNNTVIKEAGANVLQAPKEKIGSVTQRQADIVLTEWGFPKPAAAQ